MQGELTVAEMWQKSGLDWSLFVPATEVPTFLRDSKLEWLEKVNTLRIFMSVYVQDGIKKTKPPSPCHNFMIKY